ncbi:hypothetical protein IscW_ISCW002762 [Ixodes scapularis]|uniref:Uncharacterized protein n=1 Tax=Ixodes scapularis TaxID=6945 RepID=B7PB38_IXOSC|nr:hypothetical protein IscW_ISCW002762 [Ixodes scapularis]|eukprot:XP_002407663.1 hypothetical protein IscW_ISCW002762 [Ixodes scapularis]
MSPAAVAAWEKTLRLVVTVTADVYKEQRKKIFNNRLRYLDVLQRGFTYSK